MLEAFLLLVMVDGSVRGRRTEDASEAEVEFCRQPPLSTRGQEPIPLPSHCIMGNVVVSSSMAPSLLF
ncbi:hypothetical protein SRHO_G00001310 [Serrasalmus rhombeus]